MVSNALKLISVAAWEQFGLVTRPRDWSDLVLLVIATLLVQYLSRCFGTYQKERHNVGITEQGTQAVAGQHSPQVLGFAQAATEAIPAT